MTFSPQVQWLSHVLRCVYECVIPTVYACQICFQIDEFLASAIFLATLAVTNLYVFAFHQACLLGSLFVF